MSLRCAMTDSDGRCADSAAIVGLVKNGFGWHFTAVCSTHLAFLRARCLISSEEPADPMKWDDSGRWIGGDE